MKPRVYTKPRGNIGKLPPALREQINQKLQNNKESYEVIATWLLSCPVEPEGVPVSTIYDGAKNPVHCCANALQRWFVSNHFKRWEKQAAMRSDVQRRVHNIEVRFNALGDDGQDRFMMSVILEGMEKVAMGDIDAKDVFMMTSAYCSLRGLKKGDAQAVEIQRKLQVIADDAKAARDKSGELNETERTVILDRVDEIMGVRKKV